MNTTWKTLLARVTVLALLAMVAAPAAMGQAKPGTPVDPNGPKLVLTEEKKDLGTVTKGDLIKHAFTVKNGGKADLHITDVRPSCGCTVSEYDKVIKPGAEGKITLTVDTKTFSGPISKTALVLSDDPTTPQMTLFLTANVKPFVEALPYGFFRIQTLTGEPGSSELFLVSDEPDFKPTKVEISQTYLKATLVPAEEKERIPNRNPNQYKLTLTSAVDAPEGLLGGYVKVITGIKKQPEMDIAVNGYIKPTVSITPLSINFGNFDPKGEAVKRNITLISNNAQKADFAVTKAETNVAGITAEIVNVDKARVQVVLSVDQKIKKGVFEGELMIKTNDAGKAEVKVPIRGVIL